MMQYDDNDDEIEDDDDHTELEHPEEDPRTALEAWKACLRNDLEDWLETITELPSEIAEDDEIAPGEEDSPPTPPEPDLYAFYSELAASNVENKKANRRTAEAFSQWGDTLGKFDASIAELQKQIASRPKEDTGMPRSQLMAVVEMRDRLERLSKAFEAAPPKKAGWFSNTAAWEKAWQLQADASRILLSHFQTLLQELGLTRIPTQGAAFDPSLMTALSMETVPNMASQRVVEEVSPGWMHAGKLLRTAQVKVSA
jgi:molecular chaperone GrpE (heat shock protein)